MRGQVLVFFTKTDFQTLDNRNDSQQGRMRMNLSSVVKCRVCAMVCHGYQGKGEESENSGKKMPETQRVDRGDYLEGTIHDQ